MKLVVILSVALAVLGCEKDETLSGYGAADKVWSLSELDGKPFDAQATITFPEQGKIAGQAPCNRYFGAQEKPYPWFAATGVGATRMACAELGAETKFFQALEAMSLAEVLGDVMILSNEAGRQMVFKAMSQSE